MKLFNRTLFRPALITFVIVILLNLSSWTYADIIIESPWVRLVPPVSKMTAGYLVLSNTGKNDDQLIGGSSPEADSVTIHETVSKGGGVGMEERSFLSIPANGKTTLQPGGVHLMITGLKQPTNTNRLFPLILHFKNSKPITINAPMVLDSPKQ